jgi:hypothetical protein
LFLTGNPERFKWRGTAYALNHGDNCGQKQQFDEKNNQNLPQINRAICQTGRHDSILDQ